MKRAIPLLAVPAILAACSTVPSTTLQAIQQQTTAITAALAASNAILQASTTVSATVKAQSAAALTAAQAAEANVNALAAGSTYTQVITAFLEAATTAVTVLAPVMTVNQPTYIAVEAALAFVQAFIGAQPAPAALTATLMFHGPVPIPAPTVAP